MCKCIKKVLKVIAVIVAVAERPQAFTLLSKFTARKECAECTDEFVPCGAVTARRCSDEAARPKKQPLNQAKRIIIFFLISDDASHRDVFCRPAMQRPTVLDFRFAQNDMFFIILNLLRFRLCQTKREAR